MKIINVYFVTYFFYKEILSVSSTSSYYNGLIKYLKEDSKLHQVFFIRNDAVNNTDPVINSLIKEVSTHFPTLSIKFNEMSSSFKNIQKMSQQEYRRTTLFVLQLTNENYFQEIWQFGLNVQRVIKGSSQPRVLIVNSLSSVHIDLNKTLHYFWKNWMFLDMTFMTYDYYSLKLLELQPAHVPFLTQLNPFTDKYSEQNILHNSEWFPDKVQDLNEYKLNIAIYNRSDCFSTDLKRVVKFGEYLSQAMNFKFAVASANYFNIIYDLLLSVSNHASNVNLNLQVIQIGSVKAVIPNTKKRDRILVLSSELFHMLMGTIGTIVFIRMIAFTLKFKNNVWEMFSISQIMIGMPANPEPKKLLERIIFGSLLMTCLVYTGYCYSVILDINWRSVPEISSLAELAKHPLPPMSDFRVKHQLTVGTIYDNVTRDLRERTLVVPDMKLELECLEYLVQYRNISSCLLPNAEYFVNIYRNKIGELDVKILPETVMPHFSVWIPKINSPFIERFNKIILKASQHGFLKDFYETTAELQKSTPPGTVDKELLLRILCSVLVIGHSISFVVFLLEILITYRKKTK